MKPTQGQPPMVCVCMIKWLTGMFRLWWGTTSRVLVTLLVSQLVKKFPAFYYHVYKSLALVVILNQHDATGCPTRYRTRHFFNNSNTNKDIATKFEQEYVRCVRN